MTDTNRLGEWLQASEQLETTQSRVDVLEHTEEVETFNSGRGCRPDRRVPGPRP